MAQTHYIVASVGTAGKNRIHQITNFANIAIYK